jgi:hypothetical protein
VLWRCRIQDRTSREIGKLCGGVSSAAAFRKAERLHLGNRPSTRYPEGRPHCPRPATAKPTPEKPLPSLSDRPPIASAPKPVFSAPPPVEPFWLTLPVPRASRCQYPLWTGTNRAPTPPRFCDEPATRESYCEDHAKKVFLRRPLTELV